MRDLHACDIEDTAEKTFFAKNDAHKQRVSDSGRYRQGDENSPMRGHLTEMRTHFFDASDKRVTKF
jgi:hypothetical protein